jgi:ribosomal protein L37AE/L43A
MRVGVSRTVDFEPNRCTDCGRPTGRPGGSDYLRCRGCQAAFNGVLYRGGRPATPDELPPRIEELAARAAKSQPLFPTPRP